MAETSSIGLSAAQLLALAGRLDDTPGFDTPRERLRRLLIERVTDISLARLLVEQWQRTTGEQQRRAMQDIVVLLGRFLGFEPTFGSYQPLPGALRYDGQWRSRHRLHVVLEIRTEYVVRVEVESLARSLAALTTLAQLEPDTPRLGLLVAAASKGGRLGFDEVLVVEKTHPDIRIVSIHSLLTLGDMVAAGTIRHEELVRLLLSTSSLDLVAELVGRRDGRSEDSETSATDVAEENLAAAHAEVMTEEPTELPNEIPVARHWLAMILPDGAMAPDRVVDVLIGKRQLLGISDVRDDRSPVADDRVCFFVPGTGVRGHGEIASLVDEGKYQVRHGDRFECVLRLKHVDLYRAPIVPVFEKQQRFLATFGSGRISGPVLAQISPNEFTELTTSRGDAALTSPSPRSHA